jgi:GNAT superfamily N-acetyltransferase
MTSEATFSIEPVRSKDQLLAAADLFHEYAASLPIDLGYQNFSNELACLPGVYAHPGGELFLAVDPASQTPIGCIALRPLLLTGAPRCSEIKRLYVRAEGRGKGVGRALVLRVLETAVRLGYLEVRLDTLTSMDAARGLYTSVGFAECESYYETPIKETAFYSKAL